MFILPTLILAFAPINIQDVLSIDRRVPVLVAEAITVAVNEDPALPLMGNTLDEAKLMVVYAREESTFRPYAVGDHGVSLGLFQLQRMPKYLAFNATLNAKEWLARAHAAWEACPALPEEERLASLVSGNCEHGHVLARHRVFAATSRGDLLVSQSE